jgi:hypothetical protein
MNGLWNNDKIKEYGCLRRLAANLVVELEKLTGIAQEFHQTFDAVFINAASIKSSQTLIEVRAEESNERRNRVTNFRARSGR